MTNFPTPPTKQTLLGQIIEGESDILSIAQMNDMDLGALARWSAIPDVRQTLERLCHLADLQSQALLSRYRILAAGRLVHQADDPENKLSAEQVRKACLDILRTQPVKLAPLAATDAQQDEVLKLLREAIAKTDPADEAWLDEQIEIEDQKRTAARSEARGDRVVSDAGLGT